jgi:hypothetical protein
LQSWRCSEGNDELGEVGALVACKCASHAFNALRSGPAIAPRSPKSTMCGEDRGGLGDGGAMLL